MHELTIATEIIRLLEAHRQERGFVRVNVVRLRAGALAGIQPHALQFAFEIAREGSCAAQARLQIDQEPMTLRCRQCNTVRPAEAGTQTCQHCGSNELALEGQDGLDVVSIEVD
jgi:hydrogenase nickel incorporation protein HypA/HybF